MTIDYVWVKVIIDKSRSEVSLMEQDTIENVSQPIKNLHFMQLFSADATMFLIIYFALENL